MVVAEENKQSLIERLLSSPFARQFEDEDKAEITERRKERVKIIDELKSQADIAMPTLREQTEKESQKVKTLREKLESAEKKHNEVLQEQIRQSNYFTSQINGHENYLRETFDPSITRFIDEMVELDDDIRGAGPKHLGTQYTMEGNPVERFDNEAFLEVKESIRSACEQAESLKLAYVEDLPAALSELRAGLKIPSYQA